MDNEKEMYLEDLVEEWLFQTAAKLEEMRPGTEEYLLTCQAWNNVYTTWLEHKKTSLDVTSSESKMKHEKSVERMKLVYGLVTGVITAGIGWGGYALFAKVMQQWEDQGHIPLGTAFKTLIKGVKLPKIG